MGKKKSGKKTNREENLGSLEGSVVEKSEENNSNPEKEEEKVTAEKEKQKVITKKKKKKKKRKKFIEKNIVTLVVGLVVGVGILWIWWIVHDLPNSITDIRIENAETKGRLNSIDQRLNSIDGNYTALNSNTWAKNKEQSKEKLTSETEETEILLASTTFSVSMMSPKPSEEDKNDIADISDIEDDIVIGTNRESNKDETKKDIENKPFIIHYEENGEDVFFFGKYNENSQWDGKCIINRYKNSNLTSIMEAEYSKGELKRYQHVFRGTNFSDEEIWYVSNREVEGNKNSGNTTTYYFYGDCKKDFDINTLEEEDMLSVDKFIKTIPSNMEGYYSGYTSDGSYNDDSGDAYLVKYKHNGTVRRLYKGKIENGVENDDTGEAWTLSWGIAEDGYHYHKGVFEEGDEKNTTDDWKNPVDQDFINSVVNPDDFNCPLTGLVD